MFRTTVITLVALIGVSQGNNGYGYRSYLAAPNDYNQGYYNGPSYNSPQPQTWNNYPEQNYQNPQQWNNQNYGQTYQQWDGNQNQGYPLVWNGQGYQQDRYNNYNPQQGQWQNPQNNWGRPNEQYNNYNPQQEQWQNPQNWEQPNGQVATYPDVPQNGWEQPNEKVEIFPDVPSEYTEVGPVDLSELPIDCPFHREPIGMYHPKDTLEGTINQDGNYAFEKYPDNILENLDDVQNVYDDNNPDNTEVAVIGDVQEEPRAEQPEELVPDYIVPPPEPEINANDHIETQERIHEADNSLDKIYNGAHEEVNDIERKTTKESRAVRNQIGYMSVEGAGMVYGQNMDQIMDAREHEDVENGGLTRSFFSRLSLPKPLIKEPAAKEVTSNLIWPFGGNKPESVQKLPIAEITSKPLASRQNIFNLSPENDSEASTSVIKIPELENNINVFPTKPIFQTNSKLHLLLQEIKNKEKKPQLPKMSQETDIDNLENALSYSKPEEIIHVSPETTTPQEIIPLSTETTKPEEIIQVATKTAKPEEIHLMSTETSAPEEIIQVATKTAKPEEILLISTETTEPEEIIQVATKTAKPEEILLMSTETTEPEEIIQVATKTAKPEEILLMSTETTEPEEILLMSTETSTPEETREETEELIKNSTSEEIDEPSPKSPVQDMEQYNNCVMEKDAQMRALANGNANQASQCMASADARLHSSLKNIRFNLDYKYGYYKQQHAEKAEVLNICAHSQWQLCEAERQLVADNVVDYTGAVNEDLAEATVFEEIYSREASYCLEEGSKTQDGLRVQASEGVEECGQVPML